MKTAIIYHYFELNQTYKDNFIFFLNTAIHDSANYYIYISGKSSVQLPKLFNVKYFFIENKNNDFGAVLEFNKCHKDYDYYVFVNSSVRGPFLSTFNEKKWYEVFTSRLKEDVVLVGSSINLLPEKNIASVKFSQRYNKFVSPFIHVQTTSYAISADGYEVLLKEGFFNSNAELTKENVINDYEIQMSQILMNNGFAISSLLPTFGYFNSNKKSINIDNTLRNGDPLFQGAFYGRSINPLEIIFVKTNRNMISYSDLCSYTYTSLLNHCNNYALNKDGEDLLKILSTEVLKNKHKNKLFKKLIKIINDKLVNFL